MFLSADERLRMNPSLKEFSSWPIIHVESIPKQKRREFRRNIKAMKLLLAGILYSEIQKATGKHPAQLSRMKNRALAGDDDKAPALTASLIPFERLTSTKRRKSLPTFHQDCGAKCAFNYLLETITGLRQKLDDYITADIKDDPKGENLTPGSFHSYFLLCLEEAHHPQDTYPFTEDTLGYESCRVYYHKRRDYLLLQRIINQQPKRIITPKKQPVYYGREVQVDEYTYDAHVTVYLHWESGFVPLRIARFSLLVISDVDSTATLAFHLSLIKQSSQYDVLSTMIAACRFCDPASSKVQGIDFIPGPSFPNQIGKEFARIAWGRVCLDNALVHCAESVTNHVCNVHNGTLSMGIPQHPKARDIIERVFRKLSTQAKRSKSTSGKNPADPIKESRKNIKKPPILTLQALEDSIYAVLGKDNNTPKPYLMGNTPLDRVKQLVAEYPIRLLPEVDYRSTSPFILHVNAKIKWLKHESRMPHINFKYCRYQGNGLSVATIDNRNQTVEIEYDFRDIRVLHVYDRYGTFIGDVYAPKSWQRYPHGIKTRQYISRYCKKYNIRMKDPLAEYFSLQLMRKNKPKAALELSRLYQEYTGSMLRLDPSNVPIKKNTENCKPQDSLNRSEQSIKKIPDKDNEVLPWSLDMAYSKK